jgi:hypothetical protein
MRYELAGWYRNAAEIEKTIKLYGWLKKNAKDENVKYCAKVSLDSLKK